MYVRTSTATWASSTANAVAVALLDSGANYTATEVEAAFAELASTSNGEGASIIGFEDAAAQFAATDVEAAVVEIRTDLVSTSNGKGASDIGIEDSAGDITATNVEAALAEIVARAGGLNTKVLDIGDWDMDADVSVSVAHGITQTKIRSISVIIRADNNITHADFMGDTSTQTTEQYMQASATDILLVRATGGRFDNTAHDSTSFNRGWITIQYID